MRRSVLMMAAVGLALGASPEAWAQGSLPLMPIRPSGETVTPVYEGWYRNPDGSYNLSFGYLNRNSQEVVAVPEGAANHLDGGELVGQGLPASFVPRRQYGVVVVKVPASFTPEDEVTWTIDFRGRRWEIPGQIHPAYMIDALGSPASEERPPLLTVAGATVTGPRGAAAGPLRARVGEPLEIAATAALEGGDHPITVRYFKYSGPGKVTFDQEMVALEGNGAAAARATFDAPGEYVVYVRANTGLPRQYVSSGQEQCCWSNGYVKVTVTP